MYFTQKHAIIQPVGGAIMGRLVYHRKKNLGVTYVYEVVSEYWDKEKRQMRSKQKCIGKLDQETGELIPSNRYKKASSTTSVPSDVTATTTVVGPTLILGSDSLFMHTELMTLSENKRRFYLHLFYNPHKAAEDFDTFTKKLILCKQELESGRLTPAHEQDYELYFTVKETPVRGKQVEYNDAAIQAYRNKYAGFFTIMTTQKIEALEVLKIYRNKDVVEKAFDDLKNQLDMKRLRIHSSSRMAAKVFVQFISLILLSQIQQTLCKKTLSARYSPRLLLEEMESFTRIHFTGKYKDVLSELTKSQREILQEFSIDPNTL